MACAPLQRVEPRPEPPGHLPTPTNSIVPALDTVLRENGIVTAGFPAIVRRKVFDPIGMDQAAIAVNKQQLGHMVRAVDADGTFHGAYCRPEGWCKEDGDYSAADDLIVSIPEFTRFLGAVHAADGYSEALATERNRVQTTRGKDQLIDCPANVGVRCPIEQGYGLGFEVAHFRDYTMIGHGGSDWAEATLAYVYQPSGDGLIIFLNA